MPLTDLLAKTAAVLGKTDDARRLRRACSGKSDGVQREFCDPGRPRGEATQTAYVLALAVRSPGRGQAGAGGQRLVDEVEAIRNHVTTGFHGDALPVPGAE